MKRITYLFFLVMGVVFASCEQTSKGVSEVTTYPTIELKGDIALTISVGGTYVDPGVIAKEGETDITSAVVTEGTVDPSKAGVYTIKYTAYNSDGFKISKRRYIGVVTPAAAAMDISGVYKRNAGAMGLATIEKTKYSGLYVNNNPGGIAIETGVNEIYVYMFHTEPTVVSVPTQDSSVGDFACTGGVYDASGATPLYKWVCVNAGYGTAVRTFVKQ